VDTACSSSLVGTHYVYQAMRYGEGGDGISCGVNLPMNFEGTCMCYVANMLSLDGRCKSLDTVGDGYGRSEACVAIELGRLRRWKQLFVSDVLFLFFDSY
jgi:acyl transferase domain-containing protein